MSVQPRVASDELGAALAKVDLRYDPAWGAVRAATSGNTYHTKLTHGVTAHSTKDAADYALGLLESGENWRIERALDVLWRLVDAQDVDAHSQTYGIWSWYYDEPLDQMATPDWNWADFIGVRLVQVLHRHSDVLARRDSTLHDATRSALEHAARSIMRRDVKLSYTNIAIMGCYVTVMAGDLLADDEITAYGRDRLQRLAAFTDGGFPEYNSPAYTSVVIVLLARMLRDFSCADDLALTRGLHYRAWKEVATHWHAPSGQWAGPHSRSYATLLEGRGQSSLDVIQRGLGDRATVSPTSMTPTLGQLSLPLRCPDELIEFFTERAPNRDVIAEVSHGATPVTALTRLRPAYALGVASYGTFWEQARPMVAYAPGEDGPVAFRLRLLYDDRDLAAGRVFTKIHGHAVMAHICCANDIGASHPNLDFEWTGRVRASDIRLRAEFLGVPRDLLPGQAKLGETVQVRLGASAVLDLRFTDAALGEYEPWIDVGGSATDSYVDVVIYAGDERTFELTADLPFYAAMGFRLACTAAEPGEQDEFRPATCDFQLPTTPRSAAELDALAMRLHATPDVHE